MVVQRIEIRHRQPRRARIGDRLVEGSVRPVDRQIALHARTGNLHQPSGIRMIARQGHARDSQTANNHGVPVVQIVCPPRVGLHAFQKGLNAPPVEALDDPPPFRVIKEWIQPVVRQAAILGQHARAQARRQLKAQVRLVNPVRPDRLVKQRVELFKRRLLVPFLACKVKRHRMPQNALARRMADRVVGIILLRHDRHAPRDQGPAGQRGRPEFLHTGRLDGLPDLLRQPGPLDGFPNGIDGTQGPGRICTPIQMRTRDRFGIR